MKGQNGSGLVFRQENVREIECSFQSQLHQKRLKSLNHWVFGFIICQE